MSITASNAVIMLNIPLVFPAPVQLQGFSADNVFGTDALAESEVQMGVDGLLSAGFVYVPVKQNYTLMANSESNDVFDAWRAANVAQGESIEADAIVLLKSIAKKFTMTKGYLTSWQPAPDAQRVLQPRRHEITWERISPSPN